MEVHRCARHGHLLKKLAGFAETAHIDEHAPELHPKLSAERIADAELLKRHHTPSDNVYGVFQTTKRRETTSLSQIHLENKSSRHEYERSIFEHTCMRKRWGRLHPIAK